MKISRRNSSYPSGIALFILLTSLIVISLGMTELILSANTQASRVRNFGDRLQAIYIARSAQNLSRAIFLLDASQKKYANNQQQADILDDLWAKPMPFPVPTEMIQMMTQMTSGEKDLSSHEKEEMKSFNKKCDTFFEDFHGEAEAKTEDLSALLFLNSLDDPADSQKDTFGILLSLLKPNYEFERSLSARNLNPEQIAREIRDYLDKDQSELETSATEQGAYSSARLDYGPKNQPLIIPDELKLLPSMDDELYDYLTHYVVATYFPGAARRKPARINLNTIDKNMFQALLKNISNPEQLATNFIKHRKDKKFVYTDDNIQKDALKDNIGLDKQNIRINLLTGVSDAFKIVTDVTVNQVKLRVEAFTTRTAGQVKTEPVILMRVSP
jgi:type II secretory pathway component PulK